MATTVSAETEDTEEHIEDAQEKESLRCFTSHRNDT